MSILLIIVLSRFLKKSVNSLVLLITGISKNLAFDHLIPAYRQAGLILLQKGEGQKEFRDALTLIC